MDLFKEESIIFQTDILQCARLVTGANNICARTNTQLDQWNTRQFDEFVNDQYAADMVLIYENSSVESDCKDKYAVNNTSDRHIEWTCQVG